MTSSGRIPAAGASRQGLDLCVWLASSAEQHAYSPMHVERMTAATVGGAGEGSRFPNGASRRTLASAMRSQPAIRYLPRTVGSAGRFRRSGCSPIFPNLVRMWLSRHPHRDLKDAYAYS